MMPEHVQDGYPGLAKLMGPNFDQGFGIFRKFTELNARNLLYMQAEILCIEQELEILTYADERGPDPTTKSFVRSVWEMRMSPGSAQWNKILEIQGKLDSYNNCLLQQAKIAKLDRANEHDLKWLIHWLQHHEGGKGFLDGWEFKACDEKELPDLISIRSRASTDRFTRWLEMRLIPRLPTILLNMFRERMLGSEKTGLWRIKLEILNRFARTINVILSATIPMVAIIALYMINSLPYRIAAVAASRASSHLSSPPSSPVRFCTKEQVAPVTKFVSVSAPPTSRERYLPLDSDFTDYLAWTNDPDDLAIETYFDPDKEVNLGRTFNIPGLRPVLREEDVPDNFILTDDEQRWYLFDEYRRRLLWVKNEELDELEFDEEKADFILCGCGILETEAVYMDFHPANKPGARHGKVVEAGCKV